MLQGISASCARRRAVPWGGQGSSACSLLHFWKQGASCGAPIGVHRGRPAKLWLLDSAA